LPSKQSAGPSKEAAGFTLIEMMVVLVVLALMTGILVSRGPTRSATIDLNAASRTLVDALRHARGQAIITDRPVLVSVAQAREALARAAYREQAGPMALSLHSPPDDPHRDGTLRFEPDGSASSARIVVAEGHESVSITVDWLTGRITQGPIRRDDAS
jgi:general secretion pathway protein H